MVDNILTFQTEQNGFVTEYEFVAPQNNRHDLVEREIQSVDSELHLCLQDLDALTTDIDRLSNHADGLDYVIAALSGVLTGLIDSFFVGDWNMTEARVWSSQEINRRITEFANKDPEYLEFIKTRKNREDSSLSAIEFLERKYKLPGDSDWDVKTNLVRTAKEKGFDGKGYEAALQFLNDKFPRDGGWAVPDLKITAKTHHLDDLCHHPTVVGLICCIVVQFTGSSVYSHNAGEVIHLPVTVNNYGKFVGTNEPAKLFSGVVNWFMNCAQTMANRKGHLFSDMAGSFSSVKRKTEGMGLPGSFLSTMKELSALPIFKGTDFAEHLRMAYQNGIGTGKAQVDLGALNVLFDGAKFDMRTEMAIGHELKRQALPVIINEAIVRGAFFIRRFIEEVRLHCGLKGIEWKNVLPFNNRTIVRMMTIASGTFTAVDMGDAIIRSGGINTNCLLRVNFAGVGRLTIAVAADTGMGAMKAKRITDRMQIYTQMIALSEAKIFYREQAMWMTAEDASMSLALVAEVAENGIFTAAQLHSQIEHNLDEAEAGLNNIADSDPGFAASLLDQLTF